VIPRSDVDKDTKSRKSGFFILSFGGGGGVARRSRQFFSRALVATRGAAMIAFFFDLRLSFT
jgi:hypothetical protein